MEEVLQHHALDAGLFVLTEPFHDVIDGSDDRQVRVLPGHRPRQLADPPATLVDVGAVDPDDARSHDRKRQRCPSRAGTGVLDEAVPGASVRG